MGRENPPGEADIGQILAPGVDPRVDRPRRAAQKEMLIRAEG
jgi:hypothetical protein